MTPSRDQWRDRIDEPPPETGDLIFVRSIEVYRWHMGRWQKLDGLGYVDEPLPVGCEWLLVPSDADEQS